MTSVALTLLGHRPLVIAHRGSSAAEPEHTLKAYKRALREEVDGVECDVRLTLDRHLVCVHDRKVDRTSDGHGVVSAMELAKLEGMDWGKWKDAHGQDAEVPDRDKAQILTLNQLIRTMLDAGRPVDLVIETKHPTRYAGEVERRLVDSLASFDLLTPGNTNVRVRLMSFSTRAVQRFAKFAPALQRVLLLEVDTRWRYRDGLPANVAIVGPGMKIIRRNPEFVARHHDAGHAVHVWTVDKPEDIQRCLDLGVDVIISNRPADALAAVDERYGPRQSTHEGEGA